MLEQGTILYNSQQGTLVIRAAPFLRPTEAVALSCRWLLGVPHLCLPTCLCCFWFTFYSLDWKRKRVTPTRKKKWSERENAELEHWERKEKWLPHHWVGQHLTWQLRCQEVLSWSSLWCTKACMFLRSCHNLWPLPWLGSQECLSSLMVRGCIWQGRPRGGVSVSLAKCGILCLLLNQTFIILGCHTQCLLKVKSQDYYFNYRGKCFGNTSNPQKLFCCWHKYW